MNGNYRIQEIDPWPQIDIKSGLDFPYCFEAKEQKQKAKKPDNKNSQYTGRVNVGCLQAKCQLVQNSFIKRIFLFAI